METVFPWILGGVALGAIGLFFAYRGLLAYAVLAEGRHVPGWLFRAIFRPQVRELLQSGEKEDLIDVAKANIRTQYMICVVVKSPILLIILFAGLYQWASGALTLTELASQHLVLLAISCVSFVAFIKVTRLLLRRLPKSQDSAGS
ncbi:MAG: hypothetical protein FJ039_10445 [Chloroflexi bacterium]|nr:hypothetical protein [Chloroflexota bacterium]